jgi:hypothetical protein
MEERQQKRTFRLIFSEININICKILLYCQNEYDIILQS